ncbi:MAG: hypothetical protein A2157_14420 [Deltaproteobacteria bacterium RBG_16_47_11]|nr:MAG: hypothetical protein A2157_14420 [Deltaproteobacteria bacterium RBG_16_47_11]
MRFLKKGQFRQGRKKAPKGYLTPWSLHIVSFWKIHFINPSMCKTFRLSSVAMITLFGRFLEKEGEHTTFNS